MTSYSTCQQAINEEVDNYNLMVAVSLSLTALSLALYGICLRTRLHGSPRLAAQLLYVTGAMKVMVGLLLWIFFLPSCPDGCSCTANHINSLYPLIAVLIGINWIRSGRQRERAMVGTRIEGSDARTSSIDDSCEVAQTLQMVDPHIFAPLPTSDKV
jgi:hypothetical protein